ncbi:MAG: sensor histidine kinase, partial [bacterium]
MNKKIIINFIKDHMGFTLVFFINSILIALFYRISTESTIEWIYPLLFSFFLFIIFIVIRWFQYYPFNNRIGKNADDVSYDLSPATCEQKQTSSVLGKIHKQYLEKIQEIKLENKHNKRFMSQWIHNMKTPVSVIDLVIQKTENEEMSLDSAVTDINEENKRLLDQLDHILNLLRLEEFSEDYLPEELDLYQAVRKVIFNRKNQFIYNRVYPLLEEVEEPIYVLSDLKWNQVILEQIISNAIKYS